MSLKPCKECGREVSTKAIICPNCGAPIPSQRRSISFPRQSILSRIVMTLGFFFVIAWLITNQDKNGQQEKVVQLATSVNGVGLTDKNTIDDLNVEEVLEQQKLQRDKAEREAKELQKRKEREEEEDRERAKTEEIRKESLEYNYTFKDLEEHARTLTEVQFDEWEKSLKGKPVWWLGVITNVEPAYLFDDYEIGLLDDLEVYVDMDNTSIRDVGFHVPREIGISLKKKQEISFSGRIQNCKLTTFGLGVWLDDVTVAFGGKREGISKFRYRGRTGNPQGRNRRAFVAINSLLERDRH